MTVRLREVTDDERAEVGRIARSHTLGTAFVHRAQIAVHALGGLKTEEIARRMDLWGNMVRPWINRFNTRGLKGKRTCAPADRRRIRLSSAVPSSPQP
jgi:transposase-like protein